MKAGFILLEAIIAVLIMAMVSFSALEAVQIMRRSMARFAANSEIVHVRRNALALSRHLGRPGISSQGSIDYGPYAVRWSAERLDSTSYRLMTVAGPMPPTFVAIDRVTFTTTRENRPIDQFEIVVPWQVPPSENPGQLISPR